MSSPCEKGTNKSLRAWRNTHLKGVRHTPKGSARVGEKRRVGVGREAFKKGLFTASNNEKER
jgi:hypothetical protein